MLHLFLLGKIDICSVHYCIKDLEKFGKKRKGKVLGTEKPCPVFLWQVCCPLALFQPMNSYPGVRDVHNILIFLGE